MNALVEKYGTIEEFFEKYDYPNPFQEDVDITDTEFSPFKSTILRVLGLESEEKNKFSTMDPVERRRMKNKSTFQYRAIPSPIGRSPVSSSSQVTVNKRISPLRRELSSPSSVVIKSRIVVERPETRTPSYSRNLDPSSEIVRPKKKEKD